MWSYAVWGLVGAALYRCLIVRAAFLRDEDPFTHRYGRWDYPDGPGVGALVAGLCMHALLGAAVGCTAATLAGTVGTADAVKSMIALVLGAVTPIVLKPAGRLALRILIPDALDGGTEIRLTDRRYWYTPPGRPPVAADGPYPWADELARRIRAQEVARPVNLKGAHLNGTNLTGVDLPWVYAHLGTLPGVCLREANLSRGFFYVANLIGADLTRARLDRAELGSAWLVRARLTETDLTRANLTHANLLEADLAGARLRGADLGGAVLIRANLTGADLTGACLERADLTGADLSGTELTGANLAGARWTSETVWPNGPADRMRDDSEQLFDDSYRVHGWSPEPYKSKEKSQPPFFQRLLISFCDAAPAFRPLRAPDVCHGKETRAVRPARPVGRDGLRSAVKSGTAVSLSGAQLHRVDLAGVSLAGTDLSRADLTKALLTGADLSRADLTRTRLTQANLSGAKLKGANLAGANTVNADVTGATLTGANLAGVYLAGANLSGARLTRTNLTGALFSATNLTGADLTDSDLTDVALDEADLRGAELLRAQLTSADLSKADLTRAILTEADLTCAHLYAADFSQAQMIRARLTLAFLYNAKLTGADLTNADLAGADLTGARLRGAKLVGARLRGAELAGADLSGARTDGADFAEAVWSSTTKWPGAIAGAIRDRSETAPDGTYRVRTTTPGKRHSPTTGTSEP
ncbi:pentapeptide repeat-containing protein [Streptomyces sp. NPDC001073]